MLNTSDVKSLSKEGTTVSLEEISNSIGNKLSIDNLTGGNGIEIVKGTAGNKVEVKINNKGFALEGTNPSISLTDQNGDLGIFLNRYGISGKTYDSSQLVTYNFLNDRNVKTIGGQSIYGSGDISVGDKETKVLFGDRIYGSSMQSGTVTIDTSASNLQDKTITALWVRAGDANSDGMGGDDGYSYQIAIQDLYNFKNTSSATQGDFSYTLHLGIKIRRGSAITTSYSNGTQNYIIPISFEGLGTSSTYLQFGFVYKGNKFSGSEVY